jgi:S1-C subfamily serine protease
VSNVGANFSATPGGNLPPMCRTAWKQQAILFGVIAAGALGFALHLRFSAAGPSGGPTARFPAPGGAANTTDALDVQPASGLRQVGTSLRTAFNQAARIIRPSTLAVRASYGTDPVGKLLERVGSAVVVDANGYAVTCQHVVAGASSIGVRRFREQQRWLPARVVATESDLALLQITDNAPFVAATLADSSRVRVGDWVLAAGHPFDLGLTVSAGIVSRRDAAVSVPGGQSYSGLIQTDVATNEGSSGGPLVNLTGEVVGLSAAIYAPSGVFSGTSFAIDSNRVRAFVDRNLGLGSRGGERVAWGLGLSTLTPDLASKLACPFNEGVVVSSVSPNSAAAEAQIAAGDVIVAIDGAPVRDLASAQDVRSRLPGGQPVSVDLWRRGVRRTATLWASRG